MARLLGGVRLHPDAHGRGRRVAGHRMGLGRAPLGVARLGVPPNPQTAAAGILLLLGYLACLSPDGRRRGARPPAALLTFPGCARAHVPDAAIAPAAAGDISGDGSLELDTPAGAAAFEPDGAAHPAVAAYPDCVQVPNAAGQPDPVPAGRIDDASSLELCAVFESDGATRLAVAAYRLHGQDGFGVVTPERPVGMRDGFALVLDGDGRAAAHGAGPGTVGAATALPSEPGWADGGAARAWLYRHGGYLSGPSCDVRDAGAEAAVRSMARLDDVGHEAVDTGRRRRVPGMAVQFVTDVDGDYLEHPGFRAGAPSGMPVPEDGAGVRHASVRPAPGGGWGVRRGARGLGLMAGYCRGTCTP